MRNNVKRAVYDLIFDSDRPITVTEIIEWLGDVPSHSVYGALESLKPFVRGLPLKTKTYVRSDKADFAWRIQVLVAKTPMTVLDISKQLGLSKDMIQWYLNKMVQSELVLRRKVNRKFYYCVQDAFNFLLRHCNKCGQMVEYSERGKKQWMCLNCGRTSLCNTKKTH